MRVLNLRRLASLARERMIASIPSLNPVGGGIAAAFGWRTNPWPEFHKGVDLEANYGDMVRAAAAGTSPAPAGTAASGSRSTSTTATATTPGTRTSRA